jgi:tRNA pseudouridine55 synthase
LIEFVQACAKTYVATFLLGRSSETEDTESPVVELAGPPIPSHDELVAVLPRFCGEILQRPPAYSALKVHGRRAYALARRGQMVELEPRPVVIHRLAVLRYAYPELTLLVECGSGTYIRSLGRDLAAALGTAAVMSALRRTAIGGFSIDAACPLDQLTEQTLADHLLPPIRAVEHLPTVRLSQTEVEQTAHGRAIRGAIPGDAPYAAAVDEAGQLLGVLRSVQPGLLQPHRNFVG